MWFSGFWKTQSQACRGGELRPLIKIMRTFGEAQPPLSNIRLAGEVLNYALGKGGERKETVLLTDEECYNSMLDFSFI